MGHHHHASHGGGGGGGGPSHGSSVLITITHHMVVVVVVVVVSHHVGYDDVWLIDLPPEQVAGRGGCSYLCQCRPVPCPPTCVYD